MSCRRRGDHFPVLAIPWHRRHSIIWLNPCFSLFPRERARWCGTTPGATARALGLPILPAGGPLHTRGGLQRAGLCLEGLGWLTTLPIRLLLVADGGPAAVARVLLRGEVEVAESKRALGRRGTSSWAPLHKQGGQCG